MNWYIDIVKTYPIVTAIVQFGFLLVIFYRILDNLFRKDRNWANIDKGLFSLTWF